MKLSNSGKNKGLGRMTVGILWLGDLRRMEHSGFVNSIGNDEGLG